MYNSQNPLILQGDATILVEVHSPLYEEVRDELGRFAELEKSPEHVHTYRISHLSLWNAAASGLEYPEIKSFLSRYSKYQLPENVLQEIEEQLTKYGKLKIIQEDQDLYLYSKDPYLITEIINNSRVQDYITRQVDANKLLMAQGMRGQIKHVLIKLGFPVEDVAGYRPGQHFSLSLRDETREGLPLSLRDYQKQAVDIFYAGGSSKGGSGVIVFPCGGGKTITGMGVMEKVQAETLILVTNITALRQWKSELLDKTTIPKEAIGEYSGEKKEIKPITISTYQILTYRTSKNGTFPHFELFNKKDWGLIIYDEVHMLPAPIFRITSELQSKRRLGLTATLIREDGLEEDVFSLIGPKKYDVPWKELERKAWIAKATCVEVRIPLPESLKMDYAISDSRKKFRIAAENPEKIQVVYDLLQRHSTDSILIIGQYIHQLKTLASALDLPVLTGQTPNQKREEMFDKFKRGEIRELIVSKIANFAVDLPDASVAIQVSGTFGSRQEEAQRLGRILRPKAGKNTAFFYSLVTGDSREQDFATKRQMFLTEQGYSYSIQSLASTSSTS